MSENKRVYHVKDLIIKADNVFIEREEDERHHRRDQLFGRRKDRDEVEGDRDFKEEKEKEHRDDDLEGEEEEGNRKRRQRRPFWF